jgi:hypothetical protein
MRTQSVTQRFEFIRYSLGNITFLVCYFRALESRIEKTYFAVEFRVVLCFFPFFVEGYLAVSVEAKNR